MGLVGDGKWHGSADGVDIELTYLAVVGEALAAATASVAAEEAFWVGWDWDEEERVVWIGWVIDELRHPRACHVEVVVAWFACVEPPRDFELASKA